MKNILLALLLSGLLLACGGNEEKDTPADEQTQEQVNESNEETADTGENAMEEENTEDVATENTDTKKDNSTATSGKTTAATSGGWTGKVVKLADVITGNYESLTPDRVKELVLAGQYVGFLADNKFYLVYNAAGNYDWRNLARVAGQASVKIEGKTKVVNGISIIIANNIAS